MFKLIFVGQLKHEILTKIKTKKTHNRLLTNRKQKERRILKKKATRWKAYGSRWRHTHFVWQTKINHQFLSFWCCCCLVSRKNTATTKHVARMKRKQNKTRFQTIRLCWYSFGDQETTIQMQMSWRNPFFLCFFCKKVLFFFVSLSFRKRVCGVEISKNRLFCISIVSSHLCDTIDSIRKITFRYRYSQLLLLFFLLRAMLSLRAVFTTRNVHARHG